ncbi:hypothetical protein HYH03_014456 [Edaphochlamys debaryana]|uniref:Uncharacterized protein n=1 Tax=Edaphochlamys debaryana TaxID=47281 RepID=A0A835XDE7_9CHLO|nr:hypothetical protein HYH03_019104 [Edaphochlamys debaryana]KAG2481940.1 hypothetical protein HYH03_019106 [Edaphochlamys debaryana]KAG2486959.1 hypothetical protein HYH03_014456 [Edaphochlamys debaryana]|eukprot:KAG2481938.1 hypothetical protein HYH03_019104 [Edaphochlamys debaryana]
MAERGEDDDLRAGSFGPEAISRFSMALDHSTINPVHTGGELRREPTEALAEPLLGFKNRGLDPSLPESNSSLAFPSADSPWYKKMFAFAGLGFLVSVGYMDPGNWATDLAAGSAFGYTLLFVVLVSSGIAMFLQFLSLKLGVITDRDLAQACRDAYPKSVNRCLWVVAELAIAATDLAEVVGCAIAFNLLFGIPLWAGVLITFADVLVVMFFEAKSFRALEILVAVLTVLISVCFIYELAKSKPNMAKVMRGYVPSLEIITNQDMLYIATGILGATVMPHNLYLHSSVVQTRAYPRTAPGRRMAVKLGAFDSTLSLIVAFFINSSILVLAGAAFHYADPPREDVADIGDAYALLATSLGAKAASILFGVALLAAGQNSTITGTLSGQIVMEGFLSIRLRPWLRRLVTRGTAIIPAAVVAAVMGREGVANLLVMSQVILSLTLPFAVFPLVHFTSSRRYLGAYANKVWVSCIAWFLFLLISGLNINLVVQSAIAGTFGNL